jgi:hypothetical protein
MTPTTDAKVEHGPTKNTNGQPTPQLISNMLGEGIAILMCGLMVARKDKQENQSTSVQQDVQKDLADAKRFHGLLHKDLSGQYHIVYFQKTPKTDVKKAEHGTIKHTNGQHTTCSE